MKIKTKVRAGKLAVNHNVVVVPVRTKVRAGRLAVNHNQSTR
jgi:hypothetical protein